jgi:spore germination cell wall hydrolase CwlJ-like protein
MLRPRPAQPQPEGPRDLAPGKVKTVSFPRPAEAAVAAEPAPAVEVETAHQSDGAAAPQTYAVASLPAAEAALTSPKVEPLDPVDDDNAVARLGRLYFGSVPVGKNIGPIERWPGEDPIIMTARPADPDIKRAALAPHGDDAKPGETVAPKGEVTGPGQRPKSPAERLQLNTKERAKAEKCLAEAVYFESRGETKRGQIAVAQVVMNRVFSGYYPTSVCGVVYQNAHRYNACQFTFACDRVRDIVTEPDMWDQAKQIARDMLDGKLWLADIGKSTHYHAYWVHPWWAGTMRKLSRIGVHTFYRPKRWGDGAEAPTWGAGITPQNMKL